MDKYQIVEVSGEQNMHAGTKATADMAEIAKKEGFSPVYVKMSNTKPGKFAKVLRQIEFFKDWKRCYQEISEGAVVLLQHPFHYKQLTRNRVLYDLKNKKKVRFISVVHDVEELRGYLYTDYYKKEFQVMLYLSDILIVHNERMKEFFLNKGVRPEKIVVLEIFDYLQAERKAAADMPFFARSVTIAGNLDMQKSHYIAKLTEIKKIHINLFGPNYDETLGQNDNIKYHGAFPADEIPKHLNSGFGLIWDGDGIDSCTGFSGQYLKYNNPHKLSLYLSSGLPVVIWKEAAEAEFVEKNGLGICVKDLREMEERIEKMTSEEYAEYAQSVHIVKEKLVRGAFGHEAIEKALRKIKEKAERK